MDGKKTNSQPIMRPKYLLLLFLSLFCLCKSNQKICEGENCRNGKFQVQYENGDYFDGDFFEDVKHGSGIYKYSNGDIFEGEYQFGYKEGKGIYRYANGDQFIGVYQKGKRNGFGKYRFSDGLILEGNWENNELQGQSRIVNAKGSLVLEGIWKNSRWIGITPTSASSTNAVEISNPE
ncbi:hypothetical protein CH366_12140 [Leptospira harrisiae]|uniref:Membrane-binding protein n=2 Tax=Leptospira harrisiae TaxID=2023189 RepID=A0A2N0AK35_9LEPT|nr:hypothetical protein CH364_10440 [Leptospira harrisiae]PKA08094.1 hypothetical protein CH366_12140 [Leptospira harrisiae]